MKKGTRQFIAPDQWLGSILEALYAYHGKMDSPPMPFSIARSATFRNGKVICMYYSELEDDHQSSFIRKIDEANMKISRVSRFFFEENDQLDKYDVCRCISTSNAIRTIRSEEPIPNETQDVSIAYFTNSEDLCEYLKSSTFSGVVQHVSADCGPNLCETRYRMLKTTWYRQTITTEMKQNIHRASANIPVHEKFCTFDGPMHLVETYPTCSKSLNVKISALIQTIKNAVNAYIPLSTHIWNGEFYLNHSRVGLLRFEFTSFVQVVSKQHFLSLETADKLISKASPSLSAASSRPQSALGLLKNSKPSPSLMQLQFETKRPRSVNSISSCALSGLDGKSQDPNDSCFTEPKLAAKSSQLISSLFGGSESTAAPREEDRVVLEHSLNADISLNQNDSLAEPNPTRTLFAKFKEAQRRTSLHSKVARRISMLNKCDLVEKIKTPATAAQLFKIKVKNVKTIAPRQRIDCPQCGINADYDRCDLIPVEIVLNSLQVRAKIYTIEHPNLHVNEGYMPLWELDPFVGQLYSCVALFDQTIADVIQTSGSGSRAKTISLSEWLAFSRKSKMYDKLPITKEEVVQIFEDANRCDFLSDDNQYEMTIEEFCQALIFVAQKTGYLHHIDRLNAPLSWKLLPEGDVVRCVRGMLDHLEIQDNPEFQLECSNQDGPASYILQKLKERDLSQKKWHPTNEIPLLEKIRRDNFLAKIAEVFPKNEGRKSPSRSSQSQLKSSEFVSKFADMLVSLFYVHFTTPFEDETKEARAVASLLECKEFMSCKMRVCESCILSMLGVFVSDNKTGMSLQQQAEQSPNSRSPSKSPACETHKVHSKNVSPVKSDLPRVPRLNLSPKLLQKRIAQVEHRAELEFAQDYMPVMDVHGKSREKTPIPSLVFDLKTRRERLLALLLENEQDLHCAREEFKLS